MQHLSRRHFLLAVGATGGATLLKGCSLNPPSPDSLSPKAQALTLSSATTPETTAVKLGYSRFLRLVKIANIARNK